jgi:hypothetical protein
VKPTPGPRQFRKKFLIFPKFQVPVLVVNLSVIFVMAGIIWIGMQNAFSDLKPAAGLSDGEREFYLRYLEYQAFNLQRSLLWALGVGVVVSTICTVVITHRFSGPLLRLRSYFKDLSQDGKPIPQLSFRDGDYLSDLPPLINDAIERSVNQARDQARDKKAS